MYNLKEIREIPALNRIGRNLIKPLKYINESLYVKVNRHWPLAGDISLSFNDLSFIMHSECDDFLAHSFYFDQKYREEADLRLFLEIVKNKNTFIDVGANTGIYSILGKITNPGLEVFSFEPHPNNFTRLILNHQLNNLSINHIYDVAIGNSFENIEFAIPADGRICDVSSADINFSKSMYEGEITWKSIWVKQNTLNQVINSIGNNKTDLIKIDVENYEVPVFQGGKESINKHKPEIICELFLNDDKIAFFNQFIDDCGLNVYAIENYGLKLLKNGLEHNSSGLNFFFSPYMYADFIDISDFKNLKHHR